MNERLLKFWCLKGVLLTIKACFGLTSSKDECIIYIEFCDISLKDSCLNALATEVFLWKI